MCHVDPLHNRLRGVNNYVNKGDSDRKRLLSRAGEAQISIWRKPTTACTPTEAKVPHKHLLLQYCYPLGQECRKWDRGEFTLKRRETAQTVSQGSCSRNFGPNTTPQRAVITSEQRENSTSHLAPFLAPPYMAPTLFKILVASKPWINDLHSH